MKLDIEVDEFRTFLAYFPASFYMIQGSVVKSAPFALQRGSAKPALSGTECCRRKNLYWVCRAPPTPILAHYSRILFFLN